ncbi:MAG TPA: recombinase family protein [Limnochordia bacterium]|nr:recombinase family protein [Limnochordia bacterium]
MPPEFRSFSKSDAQSAARRGVLLYLRVSKEEQAKQGNSLPEQERRLRDKFERRLGLPILGVYADEGASAFKDQDRREQFWAMIERAMTDPEVGIIAVDESSRFLRDRYKAPALKGELLQHGVTVQTVSSSYDPNNPASLFVEAIEETMAHTGSLQNREYTMRGMVGNFRQRDPATGWCFKNGGTPPYGYRSERVSTGKRDARGREVIKQIWLVDEAQAAVLRQIFDLRREHKSFKAIRDHLTGQAIPSARGGEWSTTTVQTLFREDYVRQYAGLGIWNKHYRKHRPQPGVKFKPTSEWVTEPKAHPAIITEDEAEEILALNQKMTERWAKTRKYCRSSPYLLSGDGVAGEPLFICKRCGGRMVGNRAGRGRRKYVCSTAINKGTCGRRYVDAETVEGAVIGHIRTHYLNEDFIRETVRAANEQLAAEKRGAAKDTRAERLKEIEAQLANARKAILAGVDPTALAADINRLNAEAETLRTILDRAKTKTARTLIDERQAGEILHRLLSEVESGDTAKLAAFVATFVQRLVLDPERLKVAATFLPDARSELHPIALAVGAEDAARYRVKTVPPTGIVIDAKAGGPNRAPAASVRLVRKRQRPSS